jgi:hypothetical protein
MYSTLELVIMGLIVALNLAGSIAILTTIDKRREYVPLGEGLRAAVMQLTLIGFLLWFGFLGRNMETVGELMTIVTFVAAGWRIGGFLTYLGLIENPKYATVRTPAGMIWATISTMISLSSVSLMFGLALAYGS